MSALHCTNLGRVFGSGSTATTALSGVSLAIEPGELVVLRGPSGSGKTTLLNVLGALDTPTTGEVWLGDRRLTGATEAELNEVRQRELGFVFQSFALIPLLSAAENIEMPLRVIETDATTRDERVAELLELVGLADHANQRPTELSGGQQQRVGIARALANRPRVIIADLVHTQGVAAIVSTHDPRMAEMADRVIDIRDGEIRDGVVRV